MLKRIYTLVVMLLVGGGAAVTGAESWAVGEPVYGYFYGAGSLHYGDLTAAGADGAKQMGFNVVWCRESQLDLVQSKGLRAMLHAPAEFFEGENKPYIIDSQKAASLMDDPARVARLDALIDRVKNHPALYAYFVCDEPRADLFPGLARLVAHIRARDPAPLPYINLFGYLSGAAAGRHLGTADYQTYVNQFIETVKPGLLSYDHYNFTDSPLGHYFLNIAIIRTAALETKIPFMNIVDVVHPYMATPPADLAAQAPVQTRWLAYTSLAYGCQALWHFKYAERVAAHPAMKEMGAHFVAIATQLQPLRSVGVYHRGATLPAGAVSLPAAPAFDLRGPVPASGVLLGFFGPSTDPTHVVAVNLSLTNEVAVTLVATSGRPLFLFDALTERWIAAGGDSASATLHAGCGRLFSTDAALSGGRSVRVTALPCVPLGHNR